MLMCMHALLSITLYMIIWPRFYKRKHIFAHVAVACYIVVDHWKDIFTLYETEACSVVVLCAGMCFGYDMDRCYGVWWVYCEFAVLLLWLRYLLYGLNEQSTQNKSGQPKKLLVPHYHDH